MEQLYYMYYNIKPKNALKGVTIVCFHPSTQHCENLWIYKKCIKEHAIIDWLLVHLNFVQDLQGEVPMYYKHNDEMGFLRPKNKQFVISNPCEKIGCKCDAETQNTNIN